MTVERSYEGITVEIELTAEELIRAYFEQQELFDREDVLLAIDGMSNEEIKQEYGVNRSEFEALAYRMGLEMRNCLEDWATNFWDARDRGIRDIIDFYKDGKVKI